MIKVHLETCLRGGGTLHDDDGMKYHGGRYSFSSYIDYERYLIGDA